MEDHLTVLEVLQCAQFDYRRGRTERNNCRDSSRSVGKRAWLIQFYCRLFVILEFFQPFLQIENIVNQLVVGTIGCHNVVFLHMNS